jgi:hypothetical protein
MFGHHPAGNPDRALCEAADEMGLVGKRESDADTIPSLRKASGRIGLRRRATPVRREPAARVACNSRSVI